MNGRDQQSSNQVTIDHLNGRYLVPRQYPATDQLRWRLDKLMRRRLAPGCSTFLDRALDPDDPSVWLIRRLDMDLALDVGGIDDETLARSWAGQMAASIVRTISYGDDGATTLHFPNLAAYLAQFVQDMAQGQAWGKWYYDTFDSLQSLPTGTAISEALIREPGLTEPVLLQLAERGHLARVVSVLSDANAQKVYGACYSAREQSTPGVGTGRRRSVEALLAAWPAATLRLSSGRMATVHNALRLYLAVRVKSPSLQAGDILRSAIDNLLGFADIQRQIAEPDTLATHLAQDQLPRAIKLVRKVGVTRHVEVLPYFQRVAAGDTDWLMRVVRTISEPAVLRTDEQDVAEDSAQEDQNGAPPRSEKGATASAQTLSSRFGGLFLLLPALMDLEPSKLVETVQESDLDGFDPAQIAHYLLAVKCFGQRRALEAAHDPVLSFAVGLNDPPPADILSRFSQSMTVGKSLACQARLVARLAHLRRVEGRCLVAEMIPLAPSGRKAILLRDMAQDTWVYAAPVNGERMEMMETLNEGIASVQAATGVSLSGLLLGEELGQRLEPDELSALETQLMWLSSDRLPGMAPLPAGQSREAESTTIWTINAEAIPVEMQETTKRYLARAKPAAQELAYHSLIDVKPTTVTNPHFDLIWSLAANALLKGFARRLMGFDWSSAEYLYHNFLAGTSIVQIKKHHISVELPLNPLHVVLRMAGVDGQSYTIPWLNDAEVTLSLSPG